LTTLSVSPDPSVSNPAIGKMIERALDKDGSLHPRPENVLTALRLAMSGAAEVAVKVRRGSGHGRSLTITIREQDPAKPAKAAANKV